MKITKYFVGTEKRMLNMLLQIQTTQREHTVILNKILNREQDTSSSCSFQLANIPVKSMEELESALQSDDYFKSSVSVIKRCL